MHTCRMRSLLSAVVIALPAAGTSATSHARPDIPAGPYVAIDPETLARARTGDVLTPPLGQFMLTVEHVEQRTDGTSLRGTVAGDPWGSFALTLQSGQISGGIFTRTGAFGLHPTGRTDANGAAICELASHPASNGPDCLAAPSPAALAMRPEPQTPSPSRFGGSHGAPPTRHGEPAPARCCACTDDPGTVDVLVVYTTLAKNAAGGAAALQARVQNIIDTTNLVFSNSQIDDLSLHLANFREITYNESSPDWLDHLVRVTEPADGFMDGVHAWRDDDKADCVMLIVDDTRFTGGAAWWALWDQALAFSCLNWRSAGGGILTGPHEFGHNFGCAHDHDNDLSAPYSYCWGHSYTSGSNTYGTVMSYVGTTLPYFSNPSISGPGGQPLGVPPGQSRAAYNALIVSQTRSVLANYRRSNRTRDCDNNGIDDDADLAAGAPDDNENGILDACERRLYVDPDPHAQGDALSWDQSHQDLAETLAVANLTCADVRELWAADGTHRPDSGSNDRWTRFSTRSGLAMLGGFQGLSRPGGGETAPEQRVPGAYPTILSGEIGAPGESDNSYSVADAFDTDHTAVLDGFTIRDGNSFADAGGLYGERTMIRILRCTFENNQAASSGAGAMFRDASAPTLTRCTFTGNTAGFAGGAVAINNSSLRADSCAFISNSAGWYAGAVDSFLSDATLVGSIFLQNSSGVDGGALSMGSSAVAVLASTLHANDAAGLAGGILVSGSNLAVHNSILWGNTSAAGSTQDDQLAKYSGSIGLEYSLVEGLNGSLSGTGNIGANPGFTNAGSGDLTLAPGSPAIDAGSNPLAPPDAGDLDADANTTEPIPLDAGDKPRFKNDPGSPDTGVPGNGFTQIIDMGAHEFQGNSCRADFNNDGNVNTIDVIVFLNAWSARLPSADFNGDGTVNTIDVILFLNAWTAGCQ